jgi:hypothetical protein
VFLFNGFSQRFFVRGFDCQVSRRLGGAGIPWRGINPVDLRTLSQFPDQCMFARAASEN